MPKCQLIYPFEKIGINMVKSAISRQQFILNTHSKKAYKRSSLYA